MQIHGTADGFLEDYRGEAGGGLMIIMDFNTTDLCQSISTSKCCTSAFSGFQSNNSSSPKIRWLLVNAAGIKGLAEKCHRRTQIFVFMQFY